MSSRSCPEWPQLMELAPQLQFKHYTVREAQLPADALVGLGDVDPGTAEICCDLDNNVFNRDHTDPKVAEALLASHWFELREWVERHPMA